MESSKFMVRKYAGTEGGTAVWGPIYLAKIGIWNSKLWAPKVSCPWWQNQKIVPVRPWHPARDCNGTRKSPIRMKILSEIDIAGPHPMDSPFPSIFRTTSKIKLSLSKTAPLLSVTVPWQRIWREQVRSFARKGIQRISMDIHATQIRKFLNFQHWRYGILVRQFNPIHTEEMRIPRLYSHGWSRNLRHCRVPYLLSN